MHHLVGKLKPRYQELVKMRYFEELSYEEIAEELNLPIGTVKAQLFRARDFLAQIMQKRKTQYKFSEKVINQRCKTHQLLTGILD